MGGPEKYIDAVVGNKLPKDLELSPGEWNQMVYEMIYSPHPGTDYQHVEKYRELLDFARQSYGREKLDMSMFD